jgi:hypothetical protein
MHQNLLLRYIYTFFLGLLLAFFVGLGIDTFYAGPIYPEYPAEIEAIDLKCRVPTEELSEECEEENLSANTLRTEYEEKLETYEKQRKIYDRAVSTIAVSMSIFILAIGLLLANMLGILSDGILLGGMFTLAYGIVRGFGSEDPKFRFAITAVGLFVAIILGYMRFVRRPRTAADIESKNS